MLPHSSSEIVALLCVGMRLIRLCAMRMKIADVWIWHAWHALSKRQDHMEAATKCTISAGEMVEMSKLKPNLAEPAPTRSLRPSFPEVPAQKAFWHLGKWKRFSQSAVSIAFQLRRAGSYSKAEWTNYFSNELKISWMRTLSISRCVCLQFYWCSHFGHENCVKWLACELKILTSLCSIRKRNDNNENKNK